MIQRVDIDKYGRIKPAFGSADMTTDWFLRGMCFQKIEELI